jgi:hypothetical protein
LFDIPSLSADALVMPFIIHSLVFAVSIIAITLIEVTALMELVASEH